LKKVLSPVKKRLSLVRSSPIYYLKLSELYLLTNQGNLESVLIYGNIYLLVKEKRLRSESLDRIRGFSKNEPVLFFVLADFAASILKDKRIYKNSMEKGIMALAQKTESLSPKKFVSEQLYKRLLILGKKLRRNPDFTREYIDQLMSFLEKIYEKKQFELMDLVSRSVLKILPAGKAASLAKISIADFSRRRGNFGKARVLLDCKLLKGALSTKLKDGVLNLYERCILSSVLNDGSSFQYNRVQKHLDKFEGLSGNKSAGQADRILFFSALYVVKRKLLLASYKRLFSSSAERSLMGCRFFLLGPAYFKKFDSKVEFCKELFRTSKKIETRIEGLFHELNLGISSENKEEESKRVQNMIRLINAQGLDLSPFDEFHYLYSVLRTLSFQGISSTSFESVFERAKSIVTTFGEGKESFVFVLELLKQFYEKKISRGTYIENLKKRFGTRNYLILINDGL
jgi:hypothetical protein